MNPIYSESHKLVGPDSASFIYRANHPPASYKSALTVRSDHPVVDIVNTQSDLINSKGSTTVNTWEGAKLSHTTGKSGVDFKFSSGKRAFNAVSGSTHAINFDQTNVNIGGGTPLAVDHLSLLTVSTNSTGVFALGDGPKYNNAWKATAGPGQLAAMAGHHGKK